MKLWCDTVQHTKLRCISVRRVTSQATCDVRACENGRVSSRGRGQNKDKSNQFWLKSGEFQLQCNAMLVFTETYFKHIFQSYNSN